MAKGGVKRASPGADDEKDSNPLSNVELSEEDAKKLTEAQRELGRLELVMDILSQQKLLPALEKRREVLKTIEKFWPVALMKNSLFSFYCQHSADQLALSYLEDVWVTRDSTEHRCFTLEFYFKENPFFTNNVLKKQYKYIAPPNADTKPDADGITAAMLDFSWERDVEAQAFKIDWKEPEKALTKLYPRKDGETMDDDDDEIIDMGSLFNFFELAPDTNDLGVTIANEIFSEAIEHFLGEVDDDEVDSDEEDDDDDAEEIDLEKPRSKKQKV
ncbi:hypothetical protein FB45DRAFT_915903 [Roridomyces roridus]|uniref:Nucleosome assembly protein n=1 Tax=Roridomyces roridus TaxID=1738132 RepID=A0AAD7BTQ4_9AGAR|nr:hypothetical protein FB45DRAFT_915903 [Roridomyces roridus]